MAVIIAGNSYRFKSVSDTDKYLNILTDGDLDDGINVTTYGLDENDLGQVWLTSVYIHGNPMQYLLKSAKNNNFALDRWRINNAKYNNADIYSIGTTTEDIYDQVIVFEPSGSYYKIKLAYRDNLYLTVTDEITYGNGHNVAWAAATGANNQLWLAEPYNSDSGNSSGNTPEYTGILTRYTAPLSNVNGVITVYNIPDCYQSSNGYIEETCEMHKGSMIPDGTDFSDNTDSVVSDIKSAINSLISKVYPEGTDIQDKYKYYYLFGEKRYSTDNSVCHNGVDIAGPDLSEIKALFGGEVIAKGGAVYSVYNSDLNVTFNYVHMEDHRFNIGDHINAGVVIGKQSDIGDADGSHLHFEVTKGRETAHNDTTSTNVDMVSILPYGYMFG